MLGKFFADSKLWEELLTTGDRLIVCEEERLGEKEGEKNEGDDAKGGASEGNGEEKTVEKTTEEKTEEKARQELILSMVSGADSRNSGTQKTDLLKTNTKKGNGNNRIGECIMRVREELREQLKEKKLQDGAPIRQGVGQTKTCGACKPMCRPCE
jgi:predicted NAD-dependent protein-ADP-ribosyltransferase YbiA (DUF1768 family)